MADYLVTDTELTSVANAIRTKGGTSGTLSFPTGFVSAINDIQTGGVDIPIFTVVYGASYTVTSATCNKTYAECETLVSQDYSAIVIEDYSIPDEDPNAVYVYGMSGKKDWNTSGYPIKYESVTDIGRPMHTIKLFSDESITVANSDVIDTLSVTQNGTYNAPIPKLYSQVSVTVPNTYTAGDEGKVVSNGALVAQTSDSVTQNGTVDTTLINSLTVNVSGGGGVDIPVFNIAMDYNFNITSATCNKTYAECEAFTGSSSDYSAILVEDDTIPYEDPNAIYTYGMSGSKDWNTSGYPIKYQMISSNGRPIYTVKIFSDGTVTATNSDVTDTLNVTQNGTYNAPYNKVYTQVNVTVPGATTIAQASKTNSDASALSITFTGILGAPRQFVLICAGSITRSTSVRNYYYTNITYDGTMYLTGKTYRYSGEYSYTYASNYVSHSYNDGTLTITSTNANIGYFYNTSYKLVYFY